MCGICGVITKKPIQGSIAIDKMMASLVHRGPDGEGIYKSNHTHFGMRRLSIIDINGGWQPLYNDSKTIVLIANAEIYNYVELRSMLINLGYSFKTNVDCEVIIYLYEEFGVKFLSFLRGMFAFALWDSKLNRVILARDRIGEKPLYLYEDDGRLLFASEMKTLLKSGIPSFELDPMPVHHYFHYHYIPEPDTPIKNIRKLKNGHYLLVDIDEWQLQEKMYWSFNHIEPIDGEPASLIRDELLNIAEIITRSDMPVGIALSGGLDSSAIAALVSGSTKKNITSFCVGYQTNSRYDERSDARILSKELHLEHVELELKTDDMVRAFPDLIYMQDDPIADISAYCYYSLARAARSHKVPVLIYGHGGDELFWGYPWTKRAVIESIRKKRINSSSSSSIADYFYFDLPDSVSVSDLYNYVINLAGIRPMLQRVRDSKNNKSDRMIFYELSSDFNNALYQMPSYYDPNFIDRLNGADPRDLFRYELPWENIEVNITESLMNTYLLGNGITQCDRLSMASSVEPRLPLVDYKLIETVIGLRKAQSDYNLPSKYWLKSALKGIVPDKVINKKKRGFTPPVREWYKAIFANYGKNMIDGYLVGSNVLDGNSVYKLLSARKPIGQTVPISFKALVLELWCRQMIGMS